MRWLMPDWRMDMLDAGLWQKPAKEDIHRSLAAARHALELEILGRSAYFFGECLG